MKMKPKRVKRLLNSKANRVNFDDVKNIHDQPQEEPRKCISDLQEVCENHLEGIDWDGDTGCEVEDYEWEYLDEA